MFQDTFSGEAGEGEGGEEETTTSTATSSGTFTALVRKSSVYYPLNFLSKIFTRACVLETEVHIILK